MSGVGLMLQNALPIAANLQLAREVEEAGLSSAWVSEYRARDAFTTMALLGAATRRVTIGCSIVPLYTRTPALLAMSLAALEESAPGRVALGLGASSEVIVSRWHGRERVRPLRAMREYVEATRAILSGERVDYRGEVVSVEGFQLEHPHLAAPRARLFVAALGEQMLRLAAKIADGVLLNLTAVQDLPRIRAIIDEAATQAGRSPSELIVIGDLRVGLGSPAEVQEMRERQRKQIAFYGRVPAYSRFFSEAGFADEAARMQAAWEAGERERAVAAVSDAMLDSIVAIGDPDRALERIAALLGNGMDEVIVSPWEAAAADQMVATRRVLALAAEGQSSAGARP